MKRIQLFFLSILCIGILLLAPLTSTAQHASGLYQGQYAGVHGMLINPASAPYSALRWDANVASFNFFGHNNYAFVQKTNLFHFLRNLDRLEQVPTGSDPILNPDLVYYDFKRDQSNSTASMSTDIVGPSFLYNMDKFSIGIFTRSRIHGGTHSIPSGLGYSQTQSALRGDDINVDKATLTALFWSEYGVSFSSDQIVPIEGFSFGVNFKYINGHQGGYIGSVATSTFTRPNVDTTLISSPDIEIGATRTLLDDPGSSLESNGSGLGLDIGISTHLENGILNVSLLDIGFVNLKNAEIYRIISDNTLLINTEDFQTAADGRGVISSLDRQVAEQLGIGSTLVDNQKTLGLPIRIHADYTHQIKKNVYVLGSIDQRLGLGPLTLQAENVIAITPRYETKWYMFQMPITVYEYSKLRIGAAAKVGPLIIGTDHLLSLVGKSNFRGSSLYAGIKIFPFGDGENSSSKKGKGSAVGCPVFK